MVLFFGNTKAEVHSHFRTKSSGASIHDGSYSGCYLPASPCPFPRSCYSQFLTAYPSAWDYLVAAAGFAFTFVALHDVSCQLSPLLS